MFNFLKDNEQKDKRLDRVQKILEKETIKAKAKELMIGIDPETYLGKEILWQSRQIIRLQQEIINLEKKIAELISHQNK